MESCRYFKTCESMSKKVNELVTQDALHDASLKSLHKRLDEASSMRKDGVEKLDKLHDSLLSHMAWEEEKLRNSEISMKKYNQRMSTYKWIGAIAVSIFIAYLSYMFHVGNSNGNSIIKLVEHDRATKEKLDAISCTVSDIDKFIRSKNND